MKIIAIIAIAMFVVMGAFAFDAVGNFNEAQEAHYSELTEAAR